MKSISILLISVFLFTSCNKNNKEYVPMQNKNTAAHKVKVNEVLQTGSYTYLNVTEDQDEFWMAVGRTEVEEGEELYYENAMEMKDFKSKDLDRTFDRILFVEAISSGPIMSKFQAKDSLYHKKNIKEEVNEDIHVEVAPGGITIAELYKNGKSYENKKVIIRGKVVKTNNGIMDRNWVHLKDGTSDGDKSDLTCTTQDLVEVGSIVTFEGIVALDKEFGAGYVYPLVVENAKLK